MKPSGIPHKDRAGVIAPPPVIFLLALAAGLWMDGLWPLTLNTAAWALAAGSVLLLLALAGLAWSGTSFQRARTAINPYGSTTAIVAYGPYRYSRNPMYVSMALAQIGFALLFASPAALVMLVPALALVRYGVIRAEERYLLAKFGDSYRQYRQQVRRWL